VSNVEESKRKSLTLNKADKDSIESELLKKSRQIKSEGEKKVQKKG